MTLMAIGTYSERFDETGLWTCLLKEGLKNFMELDLSSKRTDFGRTQFGRHQRIKFIHIDCLLSCKKKEKSLSPHLFLFLLTLLTQW